MRTFDKAKIVEINVTEACNLRCPNCISACGVAPSGRHMPVEVLEKFLAESDAIGRKWKTLIVTGGEPSVHPRIWDVIDLLEQYTVGHRTSLSLYTNGGTDVSREIIARKQDTWRLRIRPKTARYLNHLVTFNDAPVDQPGYVAGTCDVGCNCGFTCGLGFGADGRFYPCSSVYHIARVFGMDLQAPESIAEATHERLVAMFPLTCKYCGAWDMKHSWGIRRMNRQVTSLSWVAALARYGLTAAGRVR